jgi:NAD dependent epimerase/dehydratase family enzyme
MLDSARVVPAAALKAGFQFWYPEVGGALGNLLG